MQACIASGDFFTVGILAAAKFYLENPFYCTKKINGFYYTSQRQNRQGFYSINAALVQGFCTSDSLKSFMAKHYSKWVLFQINGIENLLQFSFVACVRNTIVLPLIFLLCRSPCILLYLLPVSPGKNVSHRSCHHCILFLQCLTQLMRRVKMICSGCHVQ